MIKVIVTIGTSLFTNYLKNNNSFKSQFETLSDLPYSSRNDYTSEIEKIKKDFNSVQKNHELSAEIKTLVKLKEEMGDQLEIYAFTTDTILSKLAADIIKDKYQDEFQFRETKIIEGLQTVDFHKYDTVGFSKLISSFKQVVFKQTDKKIATYLVISGGYKAIIPPLTVLGQIYDVQLVYIYEDSDDLIHFPSLPIHFDGSLAEQFYPYLQNIVQGKQVFNKDILHEMKDFRLVKENNQKYKITAFGELFKEYIESELPLANNTLGFFVEYKLLEYYLNNPYENRFFSVSRSKYIEFNGRRKEIDLILKDEINNEIIVVESKSFLQIYRENDFEKLKNQIEGQLSILVNGNFPVVQYHLLIHHTHKLYEDMIIPNLEKIKILVEKMGKEIQFIPVSLKVNVNLKDRSYYKNPYQKFLSGEINLKEIKIN
jgi:putative CRISPR-associated protein (TIGR02619 family)